MKKLAAHCGLLTWVLASLLQVIVSEQKSNAADKNKDATTWPATDEFEKNLAMPRRYPVVPTNNRDNFFIEPGINSEYPIWHAPYPAPGSFWPQPQSVKQNGKVMLLDVLKFRFVLTNASNYVLLNAVERYRKYIVEQKAVSRLPTAPSLESMITLANLSTVHVAVNYDGAAYPHLHMDESYEIEVSAQGRAFISANETWGALRAFETFMQMVMCAPNDLLLVNITHISDKPRLAYRGVLVDTSRHYIPKATLLTHLEGMAMNKMNVFHWHIVDDASFPYQSRVWPELSRRGAYDAVNMVYTFEDIEEIVEYARVRGIRVLPEFDMPGHTHSWGRGYPQLLTPCYLRRNLGQGQSQDDLEFDGHFGPLNPAKNFTFYFLEKLLEEVAQLFPDEYIHVGGDECGKNCWLSNPAVKAAVPGSESAPHKIYQYFLTRLFETIEKVGKKLKLKSLKAQVWQEAATDQYNEIIAATRQLNASPPTPLLPKDSIVEVWFGNPSAKQLVETGHKVVYSSCWYLDHYKGTVEWPNFYKCDPAFDEVLSTNSANLVGGEANMWSEYEDEWSILTRIWPLASTTAERLWSHIAVDVPSAAPRLEEQRCRMAMRGVAVGVASGSGACPYSEMRAPGAANLPLSLDLPVHLYDYELNRLYSGVAIGAVLTLFIGVIVYFVRLSAETETTHSSVAVQKLISFSGLIVRRKMVFGLACVVLVLLGLYAVLASSLYSSEKM